MGLDSIELLQAIEHRFGIAVCTVEAEKIYIVQDMVNTVARHLNLTDTNPTLRDKVFKRVSLAIQRLSKQPFKLSLTDSISTYVTPTNHNQWITLSRAIGMQIPVPNNQPYKTAIGLIQNPIQSTPFYNWDSITVDQFVAAICAKNYNSIFNSTKAETTYDVYIIIYGITIEKTGIDYYAFGPEKSFTDDFGLD